MLRVHLFGSLQIFLDEGRLPPLPTRRSQHLLAFLLLHAGRPWPRSLLADLLWAERTECEARRRLRNELWRVRRALEAPGRRRILEATREAIQLATGDHLWWDVREFEQAIAASEPGTGPLSPDAAEALARADALYRGELLEGCDEEWCRPHRERLRQAWHTALERLVDHHAARGDAGRAVTYGSRLVAAEPLHERARCKLLRCYWLAGDRARALRTYSDFSRLLADELGIEPAAETRELLRGIRAGSPSAGSPSTGSPGTGNPIVLRGGAGGKGSPAEPVLTTLHEMEQDLQQALTHLQRVLRTLHP